MDQKLDSEKARFAALNYVVFGLGCSRTYPDRYNAVGRAIDNRLAELGANRLLPVGLGDDSGTLELDFQQWSSTLWPRLRQHVGLDPPPSAKELVYTPHLSVKTVSPVSFPRKRPVVDAERRKLLQQTFRATVTSNEELHAFDSPKSCRHIELDISQSNIKYDAGDQVGVYPRNSVEVVASAAEVLGVNLNQYIEISAVDPAEPLPARYQQICSLRDLLTTSCDLIRLPTREALRVFALYAEDNQQKENLLHLASSEGQAEFTSLFEDNFSNIIDVLRMFTSVKLPLEVFLDVVPPLDPRFYSISSSPLVSPNSIHLTVTVVQRAVKDHRFLGVSSNWLSRMATYDFHHSVPLVLHRSALKLPQDKTTPLILIGAGSGVAPLRGIAQSRRHEWAAGEKIGEIDVYFGCDNKTEFAKYHREWEAMAAEQSVTNYVCAYAYEGKDVVFVQHRIREHHERVWRMIYDQGATVYICGNAQTMATSVYQTLLAIFSEKLGGELEGEKYILNMDSTGRLLRDIY